MNEQQKKLTEEIIDILNTPASGKRNGKTWLAYDRPPRREEKA